MTIYDLLSPVRVYVLLTFLVVAVKGTWRSRTGVLLFAVMAIVFIHEITTITLILNDIPRQYPATVFVCIHTLLWLAILRNISSSKRLVTYVAVFYIILAILSIVLFDLQDMFRYAFVFGGLLYLMSFIYDSFRELRNENLTYFTSDSYLLIAAPVLFFIGFSLIFAFKERQIGQVMITDFITLYDFTSYLVNIVYYTLINIYIYRTNKHRLWNTT